MATEYKLSYTGAEINEKLGRIPDEAIATESKLTFKADKTALDEVYTLVESKADLDHNHDDVYETKTDAQAKLNEAKSYVDTKITDLVNSAPETLDTLGELATAFEENKDVVEALDSAITNKVDKSDIATDEDVLVAMTELNVVAPISDTNNKIYTSNDGKVFTL